MELSKIAQNAGGSVIREMFNEALKLNDTISFTVGEPDFVTPQPIIEEACRDWMAGKTHYTPNSGVLEPRKAIAEYHANDLKPNPEDQIMVGCGATEVIQMALFTLVDPGDEVIIVTPAWPNYFASWPWSAQCRRSWSHARKTASCPIPTTSRRPSPTRRS